ncbi:MAG: glutathione synthase [Burkholderiales bacterium]
MRILFIADPLESFKVYKDSTFAMMAEAARRGHQLAAMLQDELAWKDGLIVGRHRALSLTGDEDEWYRVGAEATLPLRDFDAVIMRKDPPFDIEYVTSTWLLEHAQRQGARVYNDARAIRDHSEKLAIMQFAQFCVPTLVSRLADDVNAFIDQHRDVILKPLDGMGGTGIFRVGATDPNRNVIIETLSQLGTRTLMAQRYIPEIRDGDHRVLLIGGKAVPFTLARIPKAGETRGNLAAGGTGIARPLTARQREITDALGPELARRGLLLVGLDVIGDYLTEVNCTSPTCFREITAQTGVNVAGMFIDAVEVAGRAPTQSA